MFFPFVANSFDYSPYRSVSVVKRIGEQNTTKKKPLIYCVMIDNGFHEY